MTRNNISDAVGGIGSRHIEENGELSGKETKKHLAEIWGNCCVSLSNRGGSV